MTPQAKKCIEEMADNHADEEVAFGRCGFDDIAEDFRKGAQAMHDYYVANGVGEFNEKAAQKFAVDFCDEFNGSAGKCIVPVSDIMVGARWQHSQDVAALSALQAENEMLKVQLGKAERVITEGAEDDHNGEGIYVAKKYFTEKKGEDL